MAAASRSAGAPDPTTTQKPSSTLGSATRSTPRNQGFSLSYEPGTNEGSPYQDQLVTEIGGNGTAPDVFWIPGTDIARFQSEGLILDLNELATADGFYSRRLTRSRCTT